MSCLQSAARPGPLAVSVGEDCTGTQPRCEAGHNHWQRLASAKPVPARTVPCRHRHGVPMGADHDSADRFRREAADPPIGMPHERPYSRRTLDRVARETHERPVDRAAREWRGGTAHRARVVDPSSPSMRRGSRRTAAGMRASSEPRMAGVRSSSLATGLRARGSRARVHRGVDATRGLLPIAGHGQLPRGGSRVGARTLPIERSERTPGIRLVASEFVRGQITRHPDRGTSHAEHRSFRNWHEVRTSTQRGTQPST
jgi:hypothetical protein